MSDKDKDDLIIDAIAYAFNSMNKKSRVQRQYREGKNEMGRIDAETYKHIEHNQNPMQPVRHLKGGDYDTLIDLALDNRDYGWVNSLQARKQQAYKRGGE